MGIRNLQRVGVVIALSAVSSEASLISFDDQQGPYDDTIQPAVFVPSDKMSIDGVSENNVYVVDGVTVTFEGFGRVWEGYTTHHHVPGASEGKIYGVAVDATITFDAPVRVQSFWLHDGENWSDLLTVMGYNGSDPAWPEPLVGRDPLENDYQFWEATGVGDWKFDDFPITELRFTNMEFVMFDELSFEAVPEPTSWVALAGVVSLLSRRRIAG